MSVATLTGSEILYVARAKARRIVGLHLVVGSRLWASFTSMGKVLLESLPPADLAAHPPAVLPDECLAP